MTRQAIARITCAIALVMSAGPAAASATTCLREFYSGNLQEDPNQLPAADVAVLVAQVATAVGLEKGVTVIQCPYVPKAEALRATLDSFPAEDKVPPGRYIVYNGAWVKEVIGTDRVQAIALFGHEFGHHLNGHFTDRADLDRKVKEQEADRFAGCAVARTGGDLPTLEGLFARLRNDVDEQYPDRLMSLTAARKGFEDCQDRGVAPDVAEISFKVDSGQCTATSDRGCTIDYTDCISAPNEKMFIERTITVDRLFQTGNGSIWCRNSTETESLELTTDAGLRVAAEVPVKVCVNAHAESGSGFLNIGQDANVICKLEAQVMSYK